MGVTLSRVQVMASDAQSYEIPRIPASAGALIFDRAGRLLILKPTYKKGWTIPGGQVEEGGESPWEACRRETLEECGIAVARGRLVCVDFLRPKPGRPGGVRFVFDCGTVEPSTIAAITLQEGEISEHRFVELADALVLLSGPLRRRVSQARRDGLVYLEDGRPVRQVKRRTDDGRTQRGRRQDPDEPRRLLRAAAVADRQGAAARPLSPARARDRAVARRPALPRGSAGRRDRARDRRPGARGAGHRHRRGDAARELFEPLRDRARRRRHRQPRHRAGPQRNAEPGARA